MHQTIYAPRPFELRLRLLLLLLTLLVPVLPAVPLPQLETLMPAAAPAPALERARLPLVFLPAENGAFEAKTPVGAYTFAEGAVGVSLPGAELRLEFLGADAAPRGAAPLPGAVHRYKGQDPEAWQENVRMYGGVTYPALYPGVTLRYEGQSGLLKGTYTVAPGADPAAIRWSYAGAQSVTVDEATGDLRIAAAGGEALTERAPVAWQVVDGASVPVDARYVVDGAGAVRFALGAYNPALELIIDPEIVIGAYLGGREVDTAYEMALDAQGNIYMAGATFSTDFNSATGEQMGGEDVVIAKLDPTASRVLYAVYLGGVHGEEALAMAVTPAGEAWVTVSSDSVDDFPLLHAQHAQPGYSQPGLLVKLNTAGQLVYSSWLKLSFYNFTTEHNVALDAQGNAYVVGDSWDWDAEEHPGRLGLRKFSPDGRTVLMSADLGSSGADSAAFTIAVGGNGRIYIGGRTDDRWQDWPVTDGAYQTLCGGKLHAENPDWSSCGEDGFVMVVSPQGAILHSTFLGGDGSDTVQDLALAPNGDVIVVGGTHSKQFPSRNAYKDGCPSGIYSGTDSCNSREMFVTRLTSDLSSLVFSTYLGGRDRSAMEDAIAVAVDGSGNAHVLGHTNANDFPLVQAIDSSFGNGICGGFSLRPCYDATLSVFSPTGSLASSTYLGGGNEEWARSIELYNGRTYVMGTTESFDLPVTSGAVQESLGIEDDFFLMVIGEPGQTPDPTPGPTPDPNPSPSPSPSPDPSQPNRVYLPAVQR